MSAEPLPQRVVDALALVEGLDPAIRTAALNMSTTTGLSLEECVAAVQAASLSFTHGCDGRCKAKHPGGSFWAEATYPPDRGAGFPYIVMHTCAVSS